MVTAVLTIQADKKARDGMWLVLSISTDSLTIRILLADTKYSTKLQSKALYNFVFLVYVGLRMAVSTK